LSGPTFRLAHSEEEERLARFCAEAFSADPSYFERRWRLDPAPDSFSLVLEIADQLVGHVHVFDRELELGSGPARCAGLANVAVSSRHRGKGYARLLLTECLRRCTEDGYKLSLLYTHVPAVYQAVGFEQVPEREVILPAGDGAGWVWGPERGEDRELYGREYGGRPWTVHRDAAYWTARLGWLPAEGWQLLGSQEADGYCWVKVEGDGGLVDEAVGECARRLRMGAPGSGSWRWRVPLGASPELPEAPEGEAVAMACGLAPGVTLDSFSAPGAIGWRTDAF
jgi:predicted N-acetyltransferase YhbS